MVVTSSLIITVLFAHWVGDFVLQNRWMAENKSDWHNPDKGLVPLVAHCFVYAVILGCFTLSPMYAYVNFLFHIMIDAVTSKCNAVLVKQEDKWGFFTMIGFDQLLHMVCLVLTLGLI